MHIDLEADSAIQPVPGDFGTKLSLAARKLFVPAKLMDLAQQQAVQSAAELNSFCTAFPGSIALQLNWGPVDTFSAIEKLQNSLIKGGVISDPTKVKAYVPGLI